MALMFSRLAHNFAKNGYYPTDAESIQRILNALDASGAVTILDPCCGEGIALAEAKHSLETRGAHVQAYGVEYDAERAWHAKQLLDVAAHADIHDMAIKVRQFGLLLLNPPYGDLLADQAQLSDMAGTGRKRLEKVFFRRAHPWLAFDGVLVLIVPHYVLDTEFAAMIAKSYADVRVFMAPEQQFKQCVVFGRKRRADRLDTGAAARLEAVGNGQLPPELPEAWTDVLYQVPVSKETPHFVAARIQPEELEAELAKLARATLWPQFHLHFGGSTSAQRRPLRSLSRWHLALALAAGQISGVVTSRDGRKLLVKGDTYKDRTLTVSFEEVGNKAGDMREVRTFTDKFVPRIRAIDCTPGPMYGHLVSIQ